MNKDTIRQSLGENMGRKIEFIDLLFEGFTSDWIEEEDNKKKPKRKQKKLKKKANGTTSSGRSVGRHKI